MSVSVSIDLGLQRTRRVTFVPRFIIASIPVTLVMIS